MIKSCEKASKPLIRDFGELENLQVSKKGPKDFVTSSDKKVENIEKEVEKEYNPENVNKTFFEQYFNRLYFSALYKGKFSDHDGK